jgi:hypothetical protein
VFHISVLQLELVTRRTGPLDFIYVEWCVGGIPQRVAGRFVSTYQDTQVLFTIFAHMCITHVCTVYVGRARGEVMSLEGGFRA